MIVATIYLIIIGILIAVGLILGDKEFIKKYKTYKNVLAFYIISVIAGYLIFINIIPDVLKSIISDVTLNFCDRVIILLMSMSTAMLVDTLLIRFYQICKEKIILTKKEKELSKSVKDYIYYRDILDGYLPGVIQYCYKKNINVDDVMVATLLDLKRKNKIKIEDEEVITNKPIYEMDITDYEKTILLYACNAERTSKKELKNKIKKEAMKTGLVRGRDGRKDRATYILEFFIAWQLLFTLINIYILFSLSSFGVIAFVCYFFNFLTIPFCKLVESKVGFIRRTKNGIEISAKLKGLKKYINEFSKIKDSSLDNIELFDEYVIYAIILDMPGKLDKEVRELYSKFKY